MTSRYFGGSISVEGGAPGYFSVEKYHDSVLSQEKARLIRNIAEDVSKILKLRTPIDEKVPLEKVIDKLKEVIPEGKGVRPDRAAHEGICRALAESINKRMPNAIIDVSAPPAEICQSVTTVMYGLFTGVSSEFVTIAADVKRLLGNMQIIRNSLQAGADKLGQIVDEQADPTAIAQKDAALTLYREIMQEFDRQAAILASLINVTITPTTRTIAELSERDKDFRGLVKSLQAEMGTRDMSSKLTHVIANINHVAILADLVDKALRTIGASVGDYKNASNTRDLVDRLYSIWARSHKNPSSDELSKFIAALEIVRRNDYAHADVARYLEKNARELSAKRTAEAKGGEAKGGAARASLESRIDRQRRSRQVLFQDFANRLDAQYRIIQQRAESLARRFGTPGIPLDDHLAQFVSAFDDLASDTFERQDFYKALTGYLTDAVSKDERARFLGRLDAVSRAAAPLTRGQAGEGFTALKGAIDKLREIVDTFADTYLRAVTPVAVSSMPTVAAVDAPVLGSAVERDEFPEPQRDAQGGAEAKRSDNVEVPSADIAEVVGAARKRRDEIKVEDAPDMIDLPDLPDMPDDIEGGAVIASSFTTLKTAAHLISNWFKIARIKLNLQSVSRELPALQKDYEPMLGEAVASIIGELRKVYEARRVQIDGIGATLPNDIADAKTIKDWEDIVGVDAVAGVVPQMGAAALIGDELKAYRKSCREAALRVLKEQLQTQINLLKTVEAVDLYLMHFTSAITANPSDVKELTELLKSVDIVAKWFTERSGDSMGAVFESFPTDYDGTIPGINKYTPGETGYYDWVAAQLRNTVPLVGLRSPFPANPFLGLMPGGKDTAAIDEVLEKIRRSVGAFRALDNIIATFAKMGAQYGAVKPAEKTFMAPGVMFKNLRDYIVQSALVIGRPLRAAGVLLTGYEGYVNDELKTRVDNKDAPAKRASAIIPHAAPAKRGIAVGVDFTSVDITVESVTAFGVGGTELQKSVIRDRQAHQLLGFAMTSIGAEIGGKHMPHNGYNDTWSRTNELFVMTLKAIISKILVSVGAYSLLNKPLESHSIASPIRTILGGAGPAPEIIPEATELYIRLTLLAEFYRGLFKFGSGSGSGDYHITMVPDFDGVFSGLLRTIFVDAQHVENGTYSESQVRAIVQEINNIYKRYRTPAERSTVTDAVNAFIADVNRRYGIVRRKEIAEYEKEQKSAGAGESKYGEEERLDFNILDEASTDGRRLAPSDRYDVAVNPLKREPEKKWADEMKIIHGLVKKFRDDLDKNIGEVEKVSGKVSFSETIRQYRHQIADAKDDAERYRLVISAISGSERLTSINNYKGLMYHEMVVSPLASLYRLYKILEAFAAEIELIDLPRLHKAIAARLKTHADVAPAAIATINAFVNTLPDAKAIAELKNGVITRGFAYEDGIATRILSDAEHNENVYVYGGTYGYIPGDAPATANLSLQGMLDLINTRQTVDGKTHPNIQAVQRFLINHESVFKRLVNAVFRLQTDSGDLVNVRIDEKHLVVDTSQLMETVKAVIVSVKKNIEKFRGVINKDVLLLAEGGAPPDGSTDDVKRNVGSLYWLEEHLVERFFKGRHGRNSLTQINEIVSGTFEALNKKWDVLARTAPAGATYSRPGGRPPIIAVGPYATPSDSKDESGAKLAAHEQSLLYNSYDVPMSQLVFWSVQPGFRTVGPDLRKQHIMHRPDSETPDNRHWLYNVVPHQGTLNDDTDFKQYRTIEETMQGLMRSIFSETQRVVPYAQWGVNAPVTWVMPRPSEHLRPLIMDTAVAANRDEAVATAELYRGSGADHLINIAPVTNKWTLIELTTAGAGRVAAWTRFTLLLALSPAFAAFRASRASFNADGQVPGGIAFDGGVAPANCAHLDDPMAVQAGNQFIVWANTNRAEFERIANMPRGVGIADGAIENAFSTLIAGYTAPTAAVMPWAFDVLAMGGHDAGGGGVLSAALGQQGFPRAGGGVILQPAINTAGINYRYWAIIRAMAHAYMNGVIMDTRDNGQQILYDRLLPPANRPGTMTPAHILTARVPGERTVLAYPNISTQITRQGPYPIVANVPPMPFTSNIHIRPDLSLFTEYGTRVNWDRVTTDTCDVEIPQALKDQSALPRPDPLAKSLYDNLTRYKTLFAQRQRIKQSTWMEPISQRFPYYRNPDHPERGPYLSHQWTSGEYNDADEVRDEEAREPSLIISLNEMLARYLYMGWDSTARKMYSGLIGKFANGSHVNATRGKALNDIRQQAETDYQIGVPPDHVTIFATLARFMRNIMIATKSRSTDPEFRIDSLMDVPLHMKETFRASLPAFTKLFGLIMRKADLLRQITHCTHLTRQIPAYHSPFVTAPALQPVVLPATLALRQAYHPSGYYYLGSVDTPPTVNTADGVAWVVNDAIAGNTQARIDAQLRRQRNDVIAEGLYERYAPLEYLDDTVCRRWYTALLDDISGAASSISRCASDVYKDLGDEPKFLETREGFIAEFQSQHKKRPIMLTSQLQIAIRDPRGEWDRAMSRGYARPNFMLPFYRSGESPFKLLYGARLVLNRPDVRPTLEFMPGMNDLLERYNGVSSGDARIDKSDYESSVINHLRLLRFGVDCLHYKPALGAGTFSYPQGAGPILAKRPFDMDDTKWLEKAHPYAVDHTLDEVVAVTESSDQESSIKDVLTNIAHRRDAPSNRAAARTLCLIDLNIPPVNIHALMKDVPLNNLWNYSFTYDRMIVDALLGRSAPVPEDKQGNARTGAELMTKLLVHPYASLDSREFYGEFARIATGDLGLADLGRPKFIGDQMWGKALLQDQYALPSPVPDEAGPRADTAIVRALNSVMATTLYITTYPVAGAAGNVLVNPILHADNWYHGVIKQDILARVVDGFALLAPDVRAELKTRVRVTDEVRELSRLLYQVIYDVTIDPTVPGTQVINAAGAYNQRVGPAVAQVANRTIAQDIAEHAIPNNRGYTNTLSAPPGIGSQRGAPPRVYYVRDAEVSTVFSHADVGLLTNAASPNNINAYILALRADRRFQSSAIDFLESKFVPATQWHTILSTFVRAIYERTIHDMLRASHTVSVPQRSTTLQYLGTGSDGRPEVKSLSLLPTTPVPGRVDPSDIRYDVSVIGRLRFDTIFARNFIFLSQAQRVLRMIMRSDTSHLEGSVVSSERVLSRLITEYTGNERYDPTTYS